MTNDNVGDLTVRILREIRDGVRETNDRLEQTNDRLDQTNDRLDQTNTRLSALTLEVRSGFDRLDQRIDKRIDNVLLGEHGREHTNLRERIERLEQHLGL